MVCKNCGQKFASNKINVIKGGCNSSGPCNATAASWQQLYNLYISNSNSK
jgi:hypothetical protein